MEIIARAQSIRISPRKVRLVADSIRGLSLDNALDILSLTQKRGASILKSVLKSAIANAVNNAKKEQKNLKIKEVQILDGTGLKRYHPSTRGRVHPYKKRSSNIKIILTDDQNEKLKIKNEK